jgi:putative inorganic carbon (hco3(-)) transporter
MNPGLLTASPNVESPYRWAFAGSALGVLFLTAMQLDPKWCAMVLGAVLVGTISLGIRDPKAYYLVLLSLSLPVFLDVNVAFQRSVFYRSTYGFLIYVSQIPLLLLLLVDGYRWLLEGRPFARILHGKGPLLGFFLLCSVSLFTARDSLFASFDLFALVGSILLFGYMASAIENQRHLRLIVAPLIVGMTLQSLIAVLQALTSSSLGLEFLGAGKILDSYAGLALISRAGGTLGHPNSMALFLDLLLPLNLSLLFCPMKRSQRLLLVGTLVIGIAGLSATLSRGGLFSTFLVFSFLLFYQGKKRLGFFQIVTYMTLLSTIALAAILLTSNPIQKRFLKEDYGNAFGRVVLMRAAVGLIQDNPVLGVGLNHYTQVSRAFDQSPEQIVSTWNTPVHNLLLFVAGETGLVGLGFFLAFVYAVLRSVWCGRASPEPFLSSCALGFFGGLVAFLIHSQVDYCHWTHFSPFWLVTGLAVSVGRLAFSPDGPLVGDSRPGRLPR